MIQINGLNEQEIIARAKEIINIEQSSLQKTQESIGSLFYHAIKMLSKISGRIMVTGIGKSGLVGQKIASTLSSTGTKAYFIHAAEAAHGDLGAIDANDAIIALSNSGLSSEILSIIPTIKRIGAKLIAITGDIDSPLAQKSDAIIPIVIDNEACALNLAPTCSTTVMLAIGDCIALILSELNGFKSDQFALFHPGGNIGRKLTLLAIDLMRPSDEYPVGLESTPLADIVSLLTKVPTGGINIVNNTNEKYLIGLITDGDIRRALLRKEEFFKLCAGDIMTRNPITITPDTLASKALELMENRKSQLMVLPVVDRAGKAFGILRLHDILCP